LVFKADDFCATTGAAQGTDWDAGPTVPCHAISEAIAKCLGITTRRLHDTIPIPGGQKLRWNDLILRDLRACALTDNWRELSLNRGEWYRRVKEAIAAINSSAENEEKTRKDTQKKRREERLTITASSLVCDFPHCSFVGTSKAGLTNHKRQRHQQVAVAICMYCNHTFCFQELHNHQRFCSSRPHQIEH
jgi:hypothetical protein